MLYTRREQEKLFLKKNPFKWLHDQTSLSGVPLMLSFECECGYLNELDNLNIALLYSQY